MNFGEEDEGESPNKAHIAVDAESGLVHHEVCTAVNVHDLRVIDQLLHGKEKDVFADSGYRGIAKWSRRKRIRWSIAMTPAKRKALDLSKPVDALKDQIEKIKAGIRARVEHPFLATKRQFGYAKALPWAGQERGAGDDAVHTVESVDGPWKIDECWMNKPVCCDREWVNCYAERPESSIG